MRCCFCTTADVLPLARFIFRSSLTTTIIVIIPFPSFLSIPLYFLRYILHKSCFVVPFAHTSTLCCNCLLVPTVITRSSHLCTSQLLAVVIHSCTRIAAAVVCCCCLSSWFPHRLRGCITHIPLARALITRIHESIYHSETGYRRVHSRERSRKTVHTKLLRYTFVVVEGEYSKNLVHMVS